MRATRLAVLGLSVSLGCGSSPSTPSPTPTAPTAPAATLILSGIVYEVDAVGRRPLSGVTVELSDAGASWGDYGRPVTNVTGRYVFGSLSTRHYLARATKTGYDASPVVNLGYLERSTTLDFELTPAGTSNAPLAINAIDPARGLTVGGAIVRITGSGFRSGTTVTFDNSRATAFIETSTTLSVTTPAHAPGAADVALTNPDGQSVRLSRAYTYVVPDSFDFNGTWDGYALAHPESQARFGARHADMDLQFTVQNNALTSFTCGGTAVLIPPSAALVGNGEFSLEGITGRIVAATSAIGTINTMACPATRWAATKR